MTAPRDTTETSPAAPRRAPLGRILITVLLTLLEAWALILVLLGVHIGGVDRVALAIALAGSVVVVIESWQGLRTRPAAAEGKPAP